MQKIQEQYRDMEEEGDILIFYTGCGRNGTTIRIAWYLSEYKNNKQRILGYSDKIERNVYPIVNAGKKAWIQGGNIPVLLVMNYATLLDDTDET